jgi:pimeloyl-ACP methyl ester carboxylesterase
VIRAALALLLLLSSCFNRAAEHCPGCAIASRSQDPPPPIEGATARVVLVGGGFGFGDEWRPVIDALRAAHVDFYVFEWPGPWRDPSLPARALATALQLDLDRAPSLRRLLVLSHSAGGMIGGFAVRRLRVPDGKQVVLAAIAAPREVDLAPFHPNESVNTPLGFAVGGVDTSTPPAPIGVAIVEYLTQDPPPRPRPGVVYLGARVSHDQSVASAGIPLVHALARSGNLWYR